jgi:hypothetical protein
MIAQIKMEDRQDGEGCVELLVAPVKGEVHSLKVNLEAGGVLLLLGDELLLFVFETGLLLLELLLGHACLVFTSLVVLLLGDV